MRSHYVSLVGNIVDPFMGYIAPQLEESVSSSPYVSSVSNSAFYSEKICLLIFVVALAFIAIISPILCFGSLFTNLQLDGLWYFWIITFSEIGYSVWLILQKRWKK